LGRKKFLKFGRSGGSPEGRRGKNTDEKRDKKKRILRAKEPARNRKLGKFTDAFIYKKSST